MSVKAERKTLYPLVILMIFPFLEAEYSGSGLLAGPLTTWPDELNTEL